jgi:TctA family transporter
MATLPNVLLGLETALQYSNLLYCFLGVIVGMLTGIIPGVGPLTAISVLFPLTFYLPPTTALIMLGGIWYGAGYGGRITAILLNIPGEPIHAVMCQDGYPLARQGRAGVALLVTALSAFIGGSIGILLLMLFGPMVADFALRLGAPEYFALMLFGMVTASTVTQGSPLKGLAMVALGVMFGSVGTDIYTGTPRFTFGDAALTKSISLVALAMGIYGITEVITSIQQAQLGNAGDLKATKDLSAKPTREDMRRFWGPTFRGSALGSILGVMPGAGTLVATFMSYAVEKRFSKNSHQMGKGAIEGIVAPEAAAGSAEMTGFIPTLTLGIPSTPSMVLMAGALIVQGITPGPALMSQHPDLFWGVVMSFWVGNLMLIVLNIPMIGLWVRLLQIPYHYLFPAILVFICIGGYVESFSEFDVWMTLFFGVVGCLLRVADLPAAPLLLGFVLGPQMEDNFRRAMLLRDGDLMIFIDRPIACVFVLLILAIIPFIVWSVVIESRRARQPQGLALSE